MWLLLLSLALPHHSSHQVGLTAILRTSQAPSCLRTFALATLSASPILLPVACRVGSFLSPPQRQCSDLPGCRAALSHAIPLLLSILHSTITV